MNSPPDPASPASTQSSGSPPPEEASSYVPASAGNNYFSNLTTHITTTLGGSSSSSKRPLPTGSSFGATFSSRNLKTRRRGEPGHPGGTWEGNIKELKKEKDELLDPALVEHLRKEIGDPFLEVGLK